MDAITISVTIRFNRSCSKHFKTTPWGEKRNKTAMDFHPSMGNFKYATRRIVCRIVRNIYYNKVKYIYNIKHLLRNLFHSHEYYNTLDIYIYIYSMQNRMKYLLYIYNKKYVYIINISYDSPYYYYCILYIYVKYLL